MSSRATFIDFEGYQVGFARLSASGTHEHDAFAHVADAKSFFCAQLQALSTLAPGQVEAALRGSVPAEAANAVFLYLQAAQVALS